MGVQPSNDNSSVIVVGIDEAGYGPLLGPLVVSAVAFEVPCSLLGEGGGTAMDGDPDYWKLLRRCVCKKPPRKGKAKLAVADSKVLYRKDGDRKDISLLERAVLTFGSLVKDRPTNRIELLCQVCPEVCQHLSRYPWYVDDVTLPICCDANDLATQRNAIRGTLNDHGIIFRGAFVEVLPEGHYNQLIAQTNNKAVVLFSRNSKLIQRVSDAVGRRPMRVLIDHHGGRIGYSRPLMNAFPEAELEILEEEELRSSYRMRQAGVPWILRFCVQGENQHLPIALASCFSKYIRELFMIGFNRYWTGRLPELRPTAGYYGDGQRFLDDIQPLLLADRIDRRWLVRAL